MSILAANDHASPLGAYLKDRRARVDPAALGFPVQRRRTPGLRREEVAQRANVSATWYTWLEQGRGGAPSADVLERIARALMLTDVEREHLFLIGLGRPPGIRYQETDGVTPRLQRVVDALELNPALVRTSTWDIVGWNRAATAVLADYGKMPADERNVLRILFCNPAVRAMQPDWESAARFMVASFRADAARAGASANIKALVDDLCDRSPDFARMWRDNDVRNFGEGTKQIRHPTAGMIALEYSSFAVDGRPDLGMVVFSPATPEDAERIRKLMKEKKAARRQLTHLRRT
jgi:transcriptional regulator with XRE-family HTH domain